MEGMEGRMVGWLDGWQHGSATGFTQKTSGSCVCMCVIFGDGYGLDLALALQLGSWSDRASDPSQPSGTRVDP